MELNRRSLLKGEAIGAVGVAGGSLIGREWLTPDAGVGGSARAAVPFRGSHQSGISTPPQRHAVFAAFDVVARDPQSVAQLLASWTDAAEHMASGRAVDADSGEASDVGPASLTVTFGFAASLFDGQCAPRSARPDGLVDLPAFDGDALDPAWGGGDLLLQVCADDPMVVSHALRQLRRLGAGTTTQRWAQHGFLPIIAGKTPRNLFGQVDGTANPKLSSAAFDELVWVRSGEGPRWMVGGTYLGLRRIRMQLTMWDRTGLDVQEAAVGRRRDSGAPLTGGGEFTAMDLHATDSKGALVIPADAHARVAKQAGPGMLRRGYSFDDGPRAIDPSAGSVDMSKAMNHSDHATSDHSHMAMAMDDQDAGLMFAAFVRDPRRQFIDVQRALSASDGLGHFLAYTSASLWAIPAGAPSGPIAGGLYA